jgi:hypothetical protein
MWSCDANGLFWLLVAAFFFGATAWGLFLRIFGLDKQRDHGDGERQ